MNQEQRQHEQSKSTIQALIHAGYFREGAQEAAVRAQMILPRISGVTIIIAIIVGYVWAK